jgi:hypothetical protein
MDRSATIAGTHPNHQAADMTEEKLLKPREYHRDANGMFERPGATIRKTAPIKKAKKSEVARREDNLPGPGPGRPKGSQNKITVALKEAILLAAERAGGDDGVVGYLERLAIENSSAFAGLLGKVLPTTLSTPESDGGLGVKMVFERHIVWPDGRREIQGKTPAKQLPSPSPVSVENNGQLINTRSDTVSRPK